MFMPTKGLIYLASPYSAPTAKKREQRFKQVCKKAAELMLSGEEVFCPIAHSHPIEVYGMTEVHSGDFWLKQDFAVLANCKKMVVYCMPGWQESKGIAREIDFATGMGIPIEFIE
jgi:hypothetical protein